MKNHILDCGHWPPGPHERERETAGGVSAATVRHILVIFFCGIGDLIVFIPALEELGRFFAASRLSVMAPSPAGDVLRHHPRIHAVHSIAALRTSRFFNRFDFIINLSGKDERINSCLRKADVMHLVFKERLFDRRDLHASDYHLELVRNIEAGFSRPLIYLTPAERRSAARFLTGVGLDPVSDLLVAVHPGAGNPSKNWDWRRFVQVCTRLARDHGAAVLLISGPNERELCRKVALEAKGRVVLVEEPLRSVAALLEKCAFVICNDSGIMHLGAAVGVPVLCLFSAAVSMPETWGPLADRRSVICKESHSAITVADVMRSARHLLSNREKHAPPA